MGTTYCSFLCKPFRGSLNLETCCLFVLYAKETSVASGHIHPSPTVPTPQHHCGIVREVEHKRGLGMKFSIMPKPIQADPCQSQSTKCVQTIQLNPTRCILRPYLGEAKYTLSYQRHRMSDWNSQFFGECKHIYYASPLQAVQIKISAAQRKINTTLCDC